MSAKDKTRSIDVDYLFENLKPLGFFQITQLMVMPFIFVFYAGTSLKFIFIGILPEVKCAELNETQLVEYGYEDNSSLLITYEKCHIEIQNLKRNINQTLSCINGYSYVPDKSTSFVSEFDLVCDKEGFSELTQTFYSLGGLLSSLCTPIITDRIGRKPVHIILSLLLLGSGIGLAFAKDYWTFAVLRLVEGFFNQGMIGPAFTLMLELIPAKQRTILAASTGVIWGVSVVSLAPLAYLIRTYSWRINSLAFISLGVIVFFEIWYLEESIRWLLTNGKIERCTRIIRRAARENKVNFDEVWEKCIESSTTLIPMGKDGYIEEDKDGDKERGRTSSRVSWVGHSTLSIPKVTNMGLMTLVRDGTARRMTLVVLINVLMNSLTYNMIYMTAAQLSGNYYLNFFLTSLMEVIGNIFMMLLLYKLERRTTIVFFQCLSGSALILGVIINFALEANSTAATAKVVLSLVGMFGISASYCVIWLYVPEIYPTNLRNVGIGMVGIAGTIGNMISPFSRVIVLYIPWLPSAVFGTGTVLSSLLLFTMPESRGQQMPSTMDEIRSWKVISDQKKLALKNGSKNEGTKAI